MKKYILLCIAVVTLLSCSVDDTVNDTFHFEVLPIRSIELPTSFEYGQVYNITYTYDRPTSCHSFNDLYYVAQGDVRTIAVISTVVNETETIDCEDLVDDIEERSFQFYVDYTGGTYIFKIWKGVDEEGQDMYEIFEVPIE